MFFRLLPFYFLLALILAGCQSAETPSTTADRSAAIDSLVTPNKLYGELLVDVQMAGIFEDGKTFVDCRPKEPVAQIVAEYQRVKEAPDFNLEQFVEAHFQLPRQYASGFRTDTSRSAAEHINALWSVLTRQPDEEARGTLIPLPEAYIVPGGRFGEIYYWDSYFSMLGLQAAGKVDMIENMVDNFAYLIDTIGFIPNGNRTYFLTRSQPPFFSLMVQLLQEERESANILVEYLPRMRKEYDFWMDGGEALTAAAPTFRRVVRMPDGAIMNRYWDMGAYPRSEMYRPDLETAERSERPDSVVYRDLRAACESGWDFSSRWLTEPKMLHTIHTTDIIPVDLNALLYHLEQTLAEAYDAQGNSAEADRFRQLAQGRREAILQYCWDDENGFFQDYNFQERAFTGVYSLAGAYPLFFEIARAGQGERAANFIRAKFLKPGGLVTTLNITGQQWDAPNGWAPLQWIAIQGLRRYGVGEVAAEAKKRWVDLNVKVYRQTGKMVEKYNVMDLGLEAGGGEYPVQDGFGWTNGVLLKLLTE